MCHWADVHRMKSTTSMALYISAIHCTRPASTVHLPAFPAAQRVCYCRVKGGVFIGPLHPLSSRLPAAQNISSSQPDAVHSTCNTFSLPPSQPSMFPYHVAGKFSASPQAGGLAVKAVGSSVASSSASKVRIRTPAQILAGRGKGVAGGAAGDAARMPVGPIVRQDRHSLKRLIISVASGHNKGGGAWGINFGTEDPTSSGTYVLATFNVKII